MKTAGFCTSLSELKAAKNGGNIVIEVPLVRSTNNANITLEP